MITVTNLIIMALIAVACWFAGKLYFKKDTERENRRRAAGQLAGKLTELGFKDLPEFFIDYSIGDYSGMAYRLSGIAQKMMGGEKVVLAELDDVFIKLLTIKLDSPEGRHFVQTKLTEMEKLLAPPVPAPPVAPPVEPPVEPVAF